MGEVIDLKGEADIEALRKSFGDPMILVDPVDPRRNVASPVSDTALLTFMAAARAFLRKPEEKFFYPEEAAVDVPALLDEIRSRASSFLYVVVEDDQVDVPDVLWGQLYKAEKTLVDQLSRAAFEVFRSAVWSDEVSRHIMVFELESASLPGTMKRMGPPVEMLENSESFVRTYIGADITVSGPWIEGGRWWVETRRTYVDARTLVEETLEDGGRSHGVSRRLGEKIRRSHRVLLDEEIGDFLEAGFECFMHSFMRGRPAWLE